MLWTEQYGCHCPWTFRRPSGTLPFIDHSSLLTFLAAPVDVSLSITEIITDKGSVPFNRVAWKYFDVFTAAVPYWQRSP